MKAGPEADLSVLWISPHPPHNSEADCVGIEPPRAVATDTMSQDTVTLDLQAELKV